MRSFALGAVLCLSLAAAFSPAGDTPKEVPWRDGSTEDLDPLQGDWQATIGTKGGWKGTLRATMRMQRNHPETSEFHTLLDLRCDLKLKRDDGQPVVTATGTAKVSLFPMVKGKQRYLQLLRDYQVTQREFLGEVLEMRPSDKKAIKAMAELRPSDKNTAPYRIAGNTWTLTVTPIVLEFLPRQAATGPKIDWVGQIVWQKVKAK
jgi:hypothetical protein